MIPWYFLKQHPTDVPHVPGVVSQPEPVPPTGTPPPASGTAPAVGGGQLEPGDVVTRYGNPPRDVSDAIKRYWPQTLWTHAAEVSFLESGWRNTAENNTLHIGPCGTRYYLPAIGGYAQTEDSVGIFQINICAHGGTVEHWHDPDANAEKGYELYRAGGWSPWTISAGRLGLL